MNLSDGEIRRRGHELLYPFIPEHVQPASVDLLLDQEFLIPGHSVDGVIDLAHVQVPYTKASRAQYLLQPGEFILGSTVERVTIPYDMIARIEGRSSLGRLGLFVHVTAGFLDPGFCGKVTLELYNANKDPILLHAGHRICQINFAQLSHIAERPYGSEGLGSHYQNQQSVTPSRFDG